MNAMSYRFLGSQDQLSKMKIVNGLLIFRLIWISLIYGVSLSWFMSGFVIFLPPILELLAITYLYIKKQVEFIMPYVLIPMAFFIYMIIRHSTNGDIFIHGANDFFLFSFSVICLLSFAEDEFTERFYTFCKTMLIISIMVAVLSYMTYLIPENISEYNLPLFLRNSLQRWHDNLASSNSFDNRFFGIELQPNTTGNWVSYGFLFGIGAYLLKPLKQNIFLLLVSAILTTIILIDTASRSAMLFSVVFLLSFIILYLVQVHKNLTSNQNKLIMIAIILCILLFIILGLFFIINPQFRNFILIKLRVEITREFDIKEISQSLSEAFNDATGRKSLRETSMEVWKNHKLFGVSTSDLNSHLPSGIWISSGSHNTIIQILATLGVIGLALFLVFVLSSFSFLIISSIRNKNKKIRIISSFSIALFIAMAVGNFYENYMYTSNAIMTLCGYFILTTGYQAYNISKNNEHQTEN